MNILLIEPMYGLEEVSPWIPIGKVCLASVLRANGFAVKIIDNALRNYSDEELIEALKEYQPDIVATGGMTLQFEDTKRIANLVRQLYQSKILLVGGGVHLTLEPEDGLNYFDFIVIGEGEDTFLELCKTYAEVNRKKSEIFKDIPGLYFMSEAGEVIRTKQRDFIYDLDRLPFPAYDLISVNDYHDFLITGEKAISIMMGRGCPYDCKFCASPRLYQRKVRNFSMEYIFAFLDYLIKNYGVSQLRIMDDTFTLDKKRVIEYCKQITKRGLKLNMTCLTHVNTSDLEMFTEMKKAGFSVVAFGIESGNNRILKLINKGISKEIAISAIKDAKKAGLIVECLFMIGNIGETRETIEDSIQFAKKFNPPYRGLKRIGFNYFQFATPFPGSRFFDEAKNYGEIISFDYNNYSHKKPVFIPKGLDTPTMLALRKKAFKKTNSAFLQRLITKVIRKYRKIMM